MANLKVETVCFPQSRPRKMVLQWARHNVADLNVFCLAFPPLYQWWKWMIIAAAEGGLGLLPLAQSSQAITQPKFTYPKNLTRHSELKPSSSQFHSLHQTSIITFLLGSSFQRPSRWEETATGGVWFSPAQLPITFISHSKKSTDDQRFTSSWSRGEKINIWRAALKGGG